MCSKQQLPSSLKVDCAYSLEEINPCSPPDPYSFVCMGGEPGNKARLYVCRHVTTNKCYRDMIGIELYCYLFPCETMQGEKPVGNKANGIHVPS